MTVKTTTVSTDPWKFQATAVDGNFSVTYTGEEGESRAKVKSTVIKMLDAKIAKITATRNGY